MSMNAEESVRIPSEEEIAAASKLKVIDIEGKEVTFGSLIEGQRTAVVFIRKAACRDTVYFCTYF